MSILANAKVVRTPAARPSLKQDPDRHYVRVQRPNQNWLDSPLDALMDEFDAVTGDSAYRIEAQGWDGDEDRRKTGGREFALLSCSQEHYETVLEQNAADAKGMELQVKSDEDLIGTVSKGATSQTSFSSRTTS